MNPKKYLSTANPAYHAVHFNQLTGDHSISVLVELIKEARPKSRFLEYPGITDLHELLALDEVKQHCLVWLDHVKKPVAFSFLDPYNNIVFECLRATDYQNLFDQALDFCLKGMREKFTCEEDLPTLDASSRADDTSRLQALKRNHFIKESIQSIAFSRDLKGNLPTSVLPEGYFIRPLKSDT